MFWMGGSVYNIYRRAFLIYLANLQMGTEWVALIEQEGRYEKSSIVHGWLEEGFHLCLAAGIYAEDKGSQG